MTPSACADEGEAPRRLLAVSLAMVAAIAVACAPAIRVALPDVTRGTTDPLGHRTVASLAAACAPMVTMTANVGVSGRVGRQRVRGSLQVGLSRPGRVRIDAVAPFGAPIFVLASDGRTTTLVLPREQAVVRDATVAEVLDALIQVPLTADDLASVLLACPRVPVDSDQSRLLPGGDVSAADAAGVMSFARVAPMPRLLGMLFPVSGQRARQIAIAFAPGGPGRRQDRRRGGRASGGAVADDAVRRRVGRHAGRRGVRGGRAARHPRHVARRAAADQPVCGPPGPVTWC